MNCTNPSTLPMRPCSGSRHHDDSMAYTVFSIDLRGSCIAGCVLLLPGLATSLLVTYRIPILHTCCGLYLACELAICSLHWGSKMTWPTLSKEFPESICYVFPLTGIICCCTALNLEYLSSTWCTSTADVCDGTRRLLKWNITATVMVDLYKSCR